MSMLCLDRGGVRVTPTELAQCHTPDGTRTHTPVPHSWFVKFVKSHLKKIGYDVTAEEHGINKTGMGYFGVMSLAGPSIRDDSDFTSVLGLRNSHDKTVPLGLAWGSNVFVCENMCFTGEVTVNRKHTARIYDDLPNQIDTTFRNLDGTKENQHHRIKVYKRAEVDKYDRAEMMVESLKQGIVSGSTLEAVIHEYDHPTKPVVEADHDTLWRLLNAYTYVFKEKVAWHQIARKTIDLQNKLFVPFCTNAA